MNGYETFQLFHAIHLHFTTDYDFFKYHGKTNITPNAWYARNDKYHFEVLGKRYNRDELIGIMVSFFLEDPEVYSSKWGGALSDHAKHGYIQWKGRMQRMQRQFFEDLLQLERIARGNDHSNPAKFKNLLRPINNPPLIKAVNSNEICLETYVIIDQILKLEKRFPAMKKSFVLEGFLTKVCNYSPFLIVNKKHYKDELTSIFE